MATEHMKDGDFKSGSLGLKDSGQIKDLRYLVNTCIIDLITLGVGTVAQGCKVWGSHKTKQTQLC